MQLNGTAGAVSRAEFARLVGVSRPAVTQAVAKGRLSGAALLDGGKLNLAEAKRQWDARKDPRGELQASVLDGAEGDPSYKQAKAREIDLRNQILELELGRKQDRYRDVDEIARATTTLWRRIRDKVETQIVAGWPEELAGLTGGDAAAIRGLLKERVRALLTDAAAAAEQLGRDEDGEDGDDEAIDA